MATAYYQVQLTVKALPHGEAELVVPVPLRKLPYGFVAVKAGGDEAIVRVEAPPATLKEAEQHDKVQRLTPKQAEALQASYAPPMLKQRFSAREPVVAGDVLLEPAAREGDRPLETLQTVRAGFYLIDVPLEALPGEPVEDTQPATEQASGTRSKQSARAESGTSRRKASDAERSDTSRS